MIVGFTGTQSGMSEPQKRVCRSLLHFFGATVVHHGDCIGADEEFHEIALSLGLRTVGHPPEDPTKRAFCVCDEMRPRKPFLDRNNDIVIQTSLLIAAPAQDNEIMRSGTWSTVRRARKAGRTIYIVYRNGSINGRMIGF